MTRGRQLAGHIRQRMERLVGRHIRQHMVVEPLVVGHKQPLVGVRMEQQLVGHIRQRMGRLVERHIRQHMGVEP